jgi:hypothetical protein
MIICDDEGWLRIDFSDWTATMVSLSYVLSKLPARPDMPDNLLDSYPIGIERLRESGGNKAVDALYRVAGELEFRPSCYDVVELGERVLAVTRELQGVKERFRSKNRPSFPTGRAIHGS